MTSPKSRAVPGEIEAWIRGIGTATESCSRNDCTPVERVEHMQTKLTGLRSSIPQALDQARAEERKDIMARIRRYHDSGLNNQDEQRAYALIYNTLADRKESTLPVTTR